MRYYSVLQHMNCVYLVKMMVEVKIPKGFKYKNVIVCM
jgi:hypothetical protein